MKDKLINEYLSMSQLPFGGNEVFNKITFLSDEQCTLMKASQLPFGGNEVLNYKVIEGSDLIVSSYVAIAFRRE